MKREGIDKKEKPLNRCSKLTIYLYKNYEEEEMPKFDEIKIPKDEYACKLEAIELGEDIDYVRDFNEKLLQGAEEKE